LSGRLKVTLDEQLSALTRRVGTLKTQLSREEGQLEALKKQRRRIVGVCKEQGVDPEQLDSVIGSKEKELSKLLKEVDAELGQIEKKREGTLGNIELEGETG